MLKNVPKPLRFLGEGIADTLQLLVSDLVFGQAKYRKRGPRLRPIIHRTYNRRTVIIREPVVVRERSGRY